MTSTVVQKCQVWFIKVTWTLVQKYQVWFKVTSTVGHVYKLEFKEQYLDWNKVPPSELFDAAVEKLEEKGSNRMPKHFREEAKGCSHLVLWLDCDREGENICFEVMQSACASDYDENSSTTTSFIKAFQLLCRLRRKF